MAGGEIRFVRNNKFRFGHTQIYSFIYTSLLNTWDVLGAKCKVLWRHSGEEWLAESCETRGNWPTQKYGFGSHINESWSYGSRCGDFGEKKVWKNFKDRVIK